MFALLAQRLRLTRGFQPESALDYLLTSPREVLLLRRVERSNARWELLGARACATGRTKSVTPP